MKNFENFEKFSGRFGPPWVPGRPETDSLRKIITKSGVETRIRALGTRFVAIFRFRKICDVDYRARGRPSVGKASGVISTQVVISLGILEKCEKFFRGVSGPGVAGNGFSAKDEIHGSILKSVPWGPVSWPFSVFAKLATSITNERLQE